jgi:hypothetical protein
MGAAGKAAIFLSGLFFGGALDHTILALKGHDRSPYGVMIGIRGNWLMAALDSALAAAAYGVHRRLARGDG